MAVYDWNGDGKINLCDDMLELHNAKQSMKYEPGSFSDKKRKPATVSAGDFRLSGVTCAAAALLGLLATEYAVSGIRKPSGFTVVFLWAVCSFIALIACGAIQAIIEGIRGK